MKKIKIILLSFFVLSNLQCKKADSTSTTGGVVLPTISVNCISSNCLGVTGSKQVYIYLTNLGCNTINTYGYTAVGYGSVNCNTSGCISGAISLSTDGAYSSGAITAGSYSICGVIDISGNFTGTVTTSDSSANQNTVIDSTGGSVLVSNWINGSF